MSVLEWLARVDLTIPATEEAVEALHECLSAYSPSVGAGPTGDLSVRIRIVAGTPRYAVDRALKVVASAASDNGMSGEIIGVEVIRPDEAHRRLDQPNVPQLVGVSDIAAMAGVTQQRATQLTQRADFPRAVEHPSSGPVFLRTQAQRFLDGPDRRGGRPRKRIGF